MKDDQIYLHNIIIGLVANVDSVVIDRIVDERGILLSVEVHKGDMGRIIGKQGDIARSIRTVMRQYAANVDKHISIKIKEPAVLEEIEIKEGLGLDVFESPNLKITYENRK